MRYSEYMLDIVERKLLGRDNIARVPKSFISTNTVFIHIPKCAGQSIAQAFYGHTVHHQKIAYYVEVAPKFLSNAFVFTCVRDPLHRFLSAYRYLSGGGRSNRDMLIYDKYIKGKSQLEVLDYLLSIPMDDNPELIHFHTQTSFLTLPGKPHLIRVDRSYDITQLDSLMRDFNSKSKLPSILREFPVANVSPRSEADVDEAVREKVKMLYRIDYVNFY